MSNNKTIVVSDLHMCDRIWEDDLFDDEYANTFIKLLQGFMDKKEYTTLILLGDIFDTWSYPLNETPPGVADIINFWSNRNRKLIDTLCDWNAAKKNIYYLNGNHDQGVKKTDLAATDLKMIKMPTPEKLAEEYPGVYLEHGHLGDLVNCNDNDSKCELQGYPLGYYITRMYYKGHKKGVTIKDGHEAVKYMLKNEKLEIVPGMEKEMSQLLKRIDEEFGGLVNLKAILEGQMTDVERGRMYILIKLNLLTLWIQVTSGTLSDEMVELPDGKGVKVEKLYELNEGIASHWATRLNGSWKALDHHLYASMNLDWYTPWFMKEGGYKAVVLGHTHKHRNPTPDNYYANDGCSCVDERDKDPGRPYYVEIDGQTISVHKYDK